MINLQSRRLTFTDPCEPFVTAEFDEERMVWKKFDGSDDRLRNRFSIQVCSLPPHHKLGALTRLLRSWQPFTQITAMGC